MGHGSRWGLRCLTLSPWPLSPSQRGENWISCVSRGPLHGETSHRYVAYTRSHRCRATVHEIIASVSHHALPCESSPEDCKPLIYQSSCEARYALHFGILTISSRDSREEARSSLRRFFEDASTNFETPVCASQPSDRLKWLLKRSSADFCLSQRRSICFCSHQTASRPTPSGSQWIAQ